MAQDVRQNRNDYIGGSDIPIILGISPFKKRFDLLLEKAGLQENEFEGNVYTEYGNVLEPKIRNYINWLYGCDFIEDKLVFGDIRCHVDGWDEYFKTILEIKTTSQIYDNISDYKVYLSQLIFYMYYYGVKRGKLAIYQRPTNFDEYFDASRLTIYEIDINDYKDFLEEILTAVDKFRIDLNKIKENPLLTEEDLQPKEVIELSNKVVALEEQLKAFKLLEKQHKELKEELFKAMENHSIKKWTTNNNVQITMVASQVDTTEEVEEFNIEKFREENPSLYEKYIEKKEIKKKGKAGYIKITLPKGN